MNNINYKRLAQGQDNGSVLTHRQPLQYGLIRMLDSKCSAKDIALYCWKHQISPTVDHPQGFGDIAKSTDVQKALLDHGYKNLQHLIDVSKREPMPSVALLLRRPDHLNAPRFVRLQGVNGVIYELLEKNAHTGAYQFPKTPFAEICGELHLNEGDFSQQEFKGTTGYLTIAVVNQAFDAKLLEYYSIKSEVSPKYRLVRSSQLAQLKLLSSGVISEADARAAHVSIDTRRVGHICVQSLATYSRGSAAVDSYVDIELDGSIVYDLDLRSGFLAWAYRVAEFDLDEVVLGGHSPSGGPATLSDAVKQQISQLQIIVGIADKFSVRPGIEYSKKELALAMGVTQIVPCNKEAIEAGFLCCGFSLARCDEILKDIVDRTFKPVPDSVYVLESDIKSKNIHLCEVPNEGSGLRVILLHDDHSKDKTYAEGLCASLRLTYSDLVFSSQVGQSGRCFIRVTVVDEDTDVPAQGESTADPVPLPTNSSTDSTLPNSSTDPAPLPNSSTKSSATSRFCSVM